MIYNPTQPSAVDLSEKFADFLQYDTVAHMKEAFSLMGRRFVGQPRKVQVAHGIARYVREHPLDVLHKCNADTLMYINKMIEMGKGSFITIGEPRVNTLQIQKMELVLTYFNKSNHTTELYMLDELHYIFEPHIAEAYMHPSDVLRQDMAKGIQSWADEIAAADDKEAKTREILLDAMLIYVNNECDSIMNAHAKQLHAKYPAEMNDKELARFEAALQTQKADLQKAVDGLSRAIEEATPAIADKRHQELSLVKKQADDVFFSIAHLQKMIDGCRRSKTDLEGYLSDLLAEADEASKSL